MAPTIVDLLERNREVSASHTPIPTLNELKALQAPTPTAMIVTCMDPRCIPERFLNLQVGEIIVCRNAGGNVRHALRDIIIADQLFDSGLDELAIIHHTDCGTLSFTEEGMRAKVKAKVPETHWAEVDKMVFGANASLEESVRAEVEWVRAHPLVSDKVKKGCKGFVFDLKTGKVGEVDA